MTTATTLGDAVFSLNMTRGEDALYKRFCRYGGTIVVVVIIIVTLVLILLKMYNSENEDQAGAGAQEPNTCPSCPGPKQQWQPADPATVTFDLPMSMWRLSDPALVPSLPLQRAFMSRSHSAGNFTEFFLVGKLRHLSYSPAADVLACALTIPATSASLLPPNQGSGDILLLPDEKLCAGETG
ncbi:Noncompact myelin-associated protein [Apodemus speciosus]|uniref:Noncompact myelin-associated protein n=1 Tax=Apodemus speciosus TaxID=105296 RepID=A0ABQ0EPT8_APOSI